MNRENDVDDVVCRISLVQDTIRNRQYRIEKVQCLVLLRDTSMSIDHLQDAILRARYITGKAQSLNAIGYTLPKALAILGRMKQ